MHSKLSDHELKKGVFKTEFSQLMTSLGKEESWAHTKAPEYIWLALIIFRGERTAQIEKCLSIINCFKESISEKNYKLLTLTNILAATPDNQTKFIDILQDHDVIDLLSPLSLVLSTDDKIFRNKLEAYTSSIENRVDNMNRVLEELSDHQSQLSTDVRYLIVYQGMCSGNFKLHISQRDIVNQLKIYPYLMISDERMRLIRPMIRSTEIGLSQAFAGDYDFGKKFWGKFGQYTECEVFAVNLNGDVNVNLERIKEKVYKSLKYYKDLIQNIKQGDEKLFVLVSMLTYSYKRLIELTEHDLQQTISGRSIVRSCIENYMMTKYLLKNEIKHENIWEEFQHYGIGNYKLIYERYREESPEIENGHVSFDYLNILVSEYINKEFIEIDTRYFGNENIRNKFKEVDEDFLYKYMYEYDSQFEHGLWGAIRESSVLKCNTPGHQYHGIPDIDNIQKLPDVGNDVKNIFENHLAEINEIYPNPYLKQLEEASDD